MNQPRVPAASIGRVDLLLGHTTDPWEQTGSHGHRAALAATHPPYHSSGRVPTADRTSRGA